MFSLAFVNLIYLSAHYPPHFESFPVELAKYGARVWAVTDLPTRYLSPQLKSSLAGNLEVDSLHNAKAVLSLCQRLQEQVGPVQFVESNLETWLDLEALLREKLSVPGLKPQDLQRFKQKRLMKEVFQTAGILVAPGLRTTSPLEAIEFCKGIGFPVILKPNIGVGAQNTYLIQSEQELLPRLNNSGPNSEFFLEKYIQGTIESFDGFCDHGGNVVYYTCHTQSAGVREIVQEKRDFYIYSMIHPPKDLVDAGFLAAKAFGVRAKFFHIEFFRTPDNQLIGLEINLRPPGGRMVDMMNFGSNIDCYRAWACTLLHNRFPYAYERQFHTMHISRRENFQYRHAIADALINFQDIIMTHGELDSASAMAMGKEYVLARSPDLKDLFSLQQFLQATDTP